MIIGSPGKYLNVYLTNAETNSYTICITTIV